MPAEVEIVISPTGDVTVEAKGVVGSGCKALTEGIERALGSVTKDVKKPEFHAAMTNGQRAVAGAGGKR